MTFGPLQVHLIFSRIEKYNVHSTEILTFSSSTNYSGHNAAPHKLRMESKQKFIQLFHRILNWFLTKFNKYRQPIL